ncbi:glycosyltransferase [Siculibacillus lacustris]|uniref:Glycosyltransferase n=1 Tax=Siculibacillus lacustris TaxID=1549641 RepID=A0A4Q9VTC1_9HYPH|nr:glycosyltransferase [Siculibacillus lacustris]TBW39297.1 glycosyltransferase [Siculibacillus lacustris]
MDPTRAARRRQTDERRRSGLPSPGIADGETRRWRAVAADLGVAFFADLAPEPLPADAEPPPPAVFARVDRLLVAPPGGEIVLIAAPAEAARAATRAHLAARPGLRARFAVAAPRVLRRALIARFALALARRAVNAVRDHDPVLSAASRCEPWQIALVAAVGLAWIAAAASLSDTLVVAWTALFLLLGFARAAIADSVPLVVPPPALADAELPHFAVLVPIHDEAPVVADLVAALGRLDYPADRLAVRLVVEADDAATLAAAEAAVADTAIETIRVPPSQPRTKPKALDFALATVDADLVCVYDAEDRPDPDQLRRAAAAFSAGPPDLAVVQAALEIDHVEADRTWLVRQFEIEYAMLFHGLLPWLAANDLFLPLGGTSNHFRRDSLVAVGGWDPHNVTEDADVAVRLARAGWRLGVVDSVTGEEAPADPRGWLAQRVRWQKGWMQTWLVHMRRPRRLHRELGWRRAVVFHLVIGGQLASAFVFLPSVVLIGLHLCGVLPFLDDRDFVDDLVLVGSLTAHAMGLAGGIALANEVGRRSDRPPRLRDLLTMPVYWALISLAAHRALIELIVAPHRWNKTSHGHVARRRR